MNRLNHYNAKRTIYVWLNGTIDCTHGEQSTLWRKVSTVDSSNVLTLKPERRRIRYKLENSVI